MINQILFENKDSFPARIDFSSGIDYQPFDSGIDSIRKT